MIRGTTQTLTFTLPIQADTITLLNIAFSQRRRIVFEKRLADVETYENTIKVTLREAETLKLMSDGSDVEIQLRVGVGDVRLASEIFRVSVDRVLKDGLLNEL